MTPATCFKRKKTEMEHGEQVRMRNLLLEFWEKAFAQPCRDESEMAVDNQDVLRVAGCCPGATRSQLR